jgi:hypothetical protein
MPLRQRLLMRRDCTDIVRPAAAFSDLFAG